MEIRDTKKKPRNRCNMCGNVLKGKERYCKHCNGLIKTIEKNKKWLELNKKFLDKSKVVEKFEKYDVLVCQECKVKTKVVDCRLICGVFIRRRECPQCKKRYNTQEVMEKRTTRQ